MYDEVCGKGKKKFLPQPNPCKVELSRSSSLHDVFIKAKELYFEGKSGSDDMDSYCLADSNGMIIKVDNKDTWTLEKYFQDNAYHASRHRVFVVLHEVIINCIILYAGKNFCGEKFLQYYI